MRSRLSGRKIVMIQCKEKKSWNEQNKQHQKNWSSPEGRVFKIKTPIIFVLMLSI